ncbi:hypothetical protein EYF80_049656 [Liparis tanakae]|uniref:Uncharacterized protein n=1 Tax=Liparis tanakae TaxID=230148 RepID=A0A4Z2FIR6_9TELE|nr:hypothetical protein EYF80_049656 [Liparis tanakae]
MPCGCRADAVRMPCGCRADAVRSTGSPTSIASPVVCLFSHKVGDHAAEKGEGRVVFTHSEEHTYSPSHRCCPSSSSSSSSRLGSRRASFPRRSPAFSRLD